MFNWDREWPYCGEVHLQYKKSWVYMFFVNYHDTTPGSKPLQICEQVMVWYWDKQKAAPPGTNTLLIWGLCYAEGVPERISSVPWVARYHEPEDYDQSVCVGNEVLFLLCGNAKLSPFCLFVSHKYLYGPNMVLNVFILPMLLSRAF